MVSAAFPGHESLRRAEANVLERRRSLSAEDLAAEAKIVLDWSTRADALAAAREIVAADREAAS